MMMGFCTARHAYQASLVSLPHGGCVFISGCVLCHGGRIVWWFFRPARNIIGSLWCVCVCVCVFLLIYNLHANDLMPILKPIPWYGPIDVHLLMCMSVYR